MTDPERLQQLLEAVLLLEADLDLDAALRHIVEQARQLVNARYGALAVIEPDSGRLAQFVNVGFTPEQVDCIDHLPRGEGILGMLFDDEHPLRLADLTQHPASAGFPANHPAMRSFVGVPVLVHGEVFGNLYLTEKIDADEFSEEDGHILQALALAAGIVVDNARMHAKVGELGVAAERARIAHDLHDTVIQRLFATGLSLQSTLRQVQAPEALRVLHTAIDDLDDTIRQIRTSIFALEPLPTGRRSPRTRVLELCAESVRSLGFEPSVSVAGPIDTEVSEHVAGHMLAVLREALTNVARHAHASRVHVNLVVAEHRLRLAVTDDGVGLPVGSGPASRGLTNMAERAKLLGGSFAIAPGPESGTETRFEVPLVTE
ncbi:MAG TPA: GAF domain-containing sensor histidine kinase [Acidimicrobiales bacterium]|nr:GAF domain-containing sensor histidine kinase [Acidimicrobiales bacterium]